MLQIQPDNVPGFSPIRSYDIPGVILQQVLDNQVTMRGLKNVLFNPDSLSPSERETFAEHMTRNVGGEKNPLIRTAMGVALNPLVWLMFLGMGMKSAGAKAMAAGTAVTEFEMGAGTWVAGNLPWLKQAALTVNQVFQDTPITDSLLYAAGLREKAYKGHAIPVAKAGGELLDSLRKKFPKLALSSLDPNDYKKGSPQWALMRKLAAVEHVVADGWHGGEVPVATLKSRQYVSRFQGVSPSGDPIYGPLEEVVGETSGEGAGKAARLRKEALLADEKRSKQTVFDTVKDEGEATEYFETTEHRADLVPLEDQHRLFNELDELTGGKFSKYFHTKQKAWKDMLADLLYNDEDYAKGQWTLDMDKVKKLYVRTTSEAMNEKGFVKGKNEYFQGREAIASLFDPKIADQIMSGKITYDQWEDMVRASANVWKKRDHRFYMPRNVMDVVPIEGVKLTRSMAEELQNNPIRFKMTNSVLPVTSEHVDPMYMPEDYEDVAEVFYGHLKDKNPGLYKERTKALFKQRDRTNKWAQSGMGEPGMVLQVPTVLKINPDRAFNRALQDYSETKAFALTPITEDMKKYQARFDKHMSNHPDEKIRNSWNLVKSARSRPPGVDGVPDSVAQYLEYMHDQLNTVNPEAAEYFRRVAMPAAMGRNDVKTTSLVSSFMFTKNALKKFTGSTLGKGIRAHGGELGDHFMSRLEKLAEAETPADLGGGMSGAIAKWLYLTHQGLNMGSVVINGMQPLLGTGPMLGVNNLAKGYADAIQDFGGYVSKRLEKFGAGPISAAQRAELRKDIVPHWEILGLGDGVWEMLDEMTFKQARPGVLNWMEYATEMAMKGFETSEIINRLSAFHAMKHLYQGAGRAVSMEAGSAFMLDAQKFVLGTQYGQHPLNTPGVFRTGFFSNPLFRQYMTFPLRSATDAFYAGPLMGGRNYFEGLSQHWMTGLGLSAIMYEVGKGMLGADLTRGLWTSSAVDVIGGDKLMEGGQEWVPLPPIASIPTEFISGFAKGDVRELSDAVARTIPGGVALNRTLGILPDIGHTPFGVFGPLQKTYAGWQQPTPDGKIPVFKADGSLIDFRNPSELVLRGLGVDLGRFSDSGQLDNFLLKNRDEIIRYRQAYLSKLVANDYRGAQGVQQEFQKRFKMPLTVTKQQVSAFVQNREAPRTERILNRIPAEGRGQYQQMVAQGPYHLGIPQQQFLQNPTVGSRDRGYQNSPVTKDQLQAMVDRAMNQNQTQGGAFEPF